MYYNDQMLCDCGNPGGKHLRECAYIRMLFDERQLKQDRLTKPIVCAWCGHKDTKREMKERQKRGHANLELRRFCSQKCQKAAWENLHGAARKARYRAALDS
jgi:hypothetical protein